MKFIKITNINGESFVNLGLVQSIEFKTATGFSGPSGEMAVLTMSDGETSITNDADQIKMLKDFVGIP